MLVNESREVEDDNADDIQQLIFGEGVITLHFVTAK